MRHSLVQRMRDITTIAGISAMAAGLWLVAGKTAGLMAQATPTPAPALVATVLRLADIPSHGELYRASFIPSSEPIALGRPLAGTIEVRTAAGAPVQGAALALESWMPEDERVAATQPRVVAELGRGRYRVKGLRFDRRGWWNVKLAVAAPAGTDSLAFNLVF
jgi:YtkA-like